MSTYFMINDYTLDTLSILEISIRHVTSFSFLFFDTCTFQKIHNRKHIKKQIYSHSDVLRITNNFNTIVGKGGFGTVYLGYIYGTPVAVKMLSTSSGAYGSLASGTLSEPDIWLLCCFRLISSQESSRNDTRQGGSWQGKKHYSIYSGLLFEWTRVS